MQDRAGNDEKIGIEGAETKSFEGQGKVLSRSCLRNLEQDTDNIQWPKIIVRHGFPEQLGSDRLSIMHTALARIFADHSVDDDGFLTDSFVSRKLIEALEEAYRAVNHPFLPLHLLAVWVGLAGIRINEATPTINVISPCSTSQ